MRRHPNKVPKSFRLDMRLTFRELRKITKSNKALNPPTISEIVTRGIVLAREARQKSRLVLSEINNDE
jgi:hypothetical protein